MAISVIAPIIQYRLVIAEQLGADRAKIMAAVGLTTSDFEEPEKRIPLNTERAVWRAIISGTGREDIGLIIASIDLSRRRFDHLFRSVKPPRSSYFVQALTSRSSRFQLPVLAAAS